MKTIYSPAHLLQHGKVELFGNKLVPCYERPERAEAIRAEIARLDFGTIVEPDDFGRDPLAAVHAPDYLEFLETAWDAWCAAGGEGDAFGCCRPMPDMGRTIPKSIFARLGYYSFDGCAPITAGTWAAAYASAQVALTGSDLLLRGERSAFSLCRPPGHHASRAYCGGYCFLNNAAIAAQSLIDKGLGRIAILDVDYHHGNGTQTIFYERSDVLFVSIHGDPDEDFPSFLGRADEAGSGSGSGFNLNLPLARGTNPEQWFCALETGLDAVARFYADAVVVSLGVDTASGEPISGFGLTSQDFLELGRRLGSLNLPTHFVMEGGYNLERIGANVGHVLRGFEQ